METWIPWDADDEEAAELNVVREQIPESLRPALLTWLTRELNQSYGSTREDLVNRLQSALRIDLQFDRGDVVTAELVEAIETEGDQLLLRVVDFCLSFYEENPYPYGPAPSEVDDLNWHLDMSASAVTTEVAGGRYRLARRLPDGVEEAAQAAVSSSPTTAGAHLAKAWAAIRGLEQSPSQAMTEAIRAVEIAAGAVVTPKDKRLQMSKIVARLKAKTDWELVLDRRDDGHPDHHQTLIGMMETLVFAQNDRHGGAEHSAAEAQAHVLLASLLVGWFSIGAVVFPKK